MADEEKKEFRKTLHDLDEGFTEGAPDEDPEVTMARAEKELHDALDVTKQDEVLEFEMPEEFKAESEKERIRRTAGGHFDAGEQPVPEKKDIWSRDIGRLGRVAVDQAEKEIYWESLFSDSRLVLPIPMQLGDRQITVVLRSLHVAEKEVIALAVDKIAGGFPIKTIDATLLVSNYSLQASVATQVVSIGGVPFEPFECMPDGGNLPEFSEKVSGLTDFVRHKVGQMHQARLRMLIDAAHIFEVKQRILEDGSANRDFQIPADTN